MIGGEPVCTKCKHFHEDDERGLTCDAFPEGIPDSILVDGDKHEGPVEGDHGIRFEPLETDKK